MCYVLYWRCEWMNTSLTLLTFYITFLSSWDVCLFSYILPLQFNSIFLMHIPRVIWECSMTTLSYFCIWNMPSRLFTKWHRHHDSFYYYLPFPAWPILGTLQCRRLSHCYVACLYFRFQFTYWLTLQRIPITTDGIFQG